MKKIIIFSIAAITLFGADLQRRVELLEMAVVKLIQKDKALEQKINENKKSSTINTQMIFTLQNKVKILNQSIKNSKETFYARVIPNRLNIRKEPNLTSKITGVLKRGNLIKIKEAAFGDGRVWYKTDKGYISSDYTALVYLKHNLPKREIKDKENK